jgi:RHS repeat-associated protein
MTGTRAFSLDPAGRITTVTGTGIATGPGPGPQWSEHYSYDPVGNISSAAWPALSDTHGGGWLDSTAQGPRSVSGTLTRRAGNIRYSHDAAGRVTQRTRTPISRKPETWRYRWNADNRLTAVTTPDGTTWHYAYDPLGRRVLKQQVTPEGRVLAETRFTWDGLTLAEQAELVPGSGDRDIISTWDYRPGTFTPLAQTMRTFLHNAPQDVFDGEFYAIVTDLAGTPTELIASDGALVGYQTHNLWGNTLWHPAGASTPIRFPGQYADDETGLHYNCARYYDPVCGAYLSPDPLGLAPAPNPHTYVPNPHVEIDPLGLDADDDCPVLNAQIQKVINYWDKTGRTPAGVMKGGARGYEGGVYTNTSGALPKRPLGYYQESDVWPTGGVQRGMDRLIFGKKGEVYFTNDHYTTFKRIR